ncbi:uncharacterized protein PGTG_20521 [Puccinia graminis f. sp. tritici CRL 75-36-700-3]|uniref:Uncharacterized protein n=1 Tax=Puccinia graminis f. sp. tritici (strain CRL 75-36-700-3 / race SCCL) TaxID=418459 RepID=E3NYB6_PUCGT|nr:uncharacterized protein PGTG_20521 [Puccinia graminis f. sp. tritici CRL 75-36-700-3]EFP94565.2 hypothetical protein PGTG_20521 [Puccinia graminis f. sp. tritici CRL 75-36-700-3]
MDGTEVFSVAGLKRGSDYDGDRSLNSQAINFLNSQHQQSYQRVVDFDLHAVFLMQEFRAEDTIQQIITMIGTTFNEEYPPKNTLQQQLVNAAKLVNQRIQNYEQQPHMQKPFCLRFPTYSDVLKHCMELQDKCEVLPNDKMVILIDEGGVCVGVGLPPKPQSTQSIHTPRDPLSAGAADKTIKFATNSIKKIDLQGHGDHWKSDPKPNLPEPLRSDPGPTMRGLVELRHDMVFYHRISYWINKVFLPDASSIAESAVKYLEKKASTAVKESIQVEKNIIIAARTITVNTHPNTHRDRNNALLMDSVFFFGNHIGGHFLLPGLGVAYPGLHGYSFHGPFRILFHGVSQFHFTEDITDPRRYSVAMWSRASSFSEIARFSAHDNGNEKFSDDKYWLPLYPEYNPKITSDLLKAEVKIAKKEAKKESKKRQKTEN